MNNTTSYVAKATNYVRGLGKKRAAGFVTADDVQRFLDRVGYTGNQNERLSIVRTVLSNGPFIAQGIVRSQRAAARGRRITQYYVA